MIRIDGGALRHLRLAKGMTQGELIKVSGLSVSTLNALECGRNEHMSDKTILALAKAFGMTALEVEKEIAAASARAEEGKAGETGPAATGDEAAAS